jgi:hypothetical protein
MSGFARDRTWCSALAADSADFVDCASAATKPAEPEAAREKGANAFPATFST